MFVKSRMVGWQYAVKTGLLFGHNTCFGCRATVKWFHYVLLFHIIYYFLAVKTTNGQKNFFKECPQNHDVKEGGTLVLNCEQDHIGSVVYTWAATNNKGPRGLILPENEFATSSRRSYQTNGPAGHLTIRKADRIDDNHVFYCVAHPSTTVEGEEPQPQVCNPAKVTVHYLEPEITVERIDPSPQSSEIGASVKLRCLAEANPPPTIVWFLNGKQITSFSTKISQSVSMSNGTLTLVGIKVIATGTYTCVVKRGLFGDAQTQVPYVLHVIDPRLPQFSLSNKMVQYLSAGDNAELKCSASASNWSARWIFSYDMSNLLTRKSSSPNLPTNVNHQLPSNSLLIKNYNARKMRGFYQCELTGRPLFPTDSGAEAAANLTVRFLYQLVTAANHQLDNLKNFEPSIKPDKPFVILENATFTLRVYVDFAVYQNDAPKWAPIPILKWKKPNNEEVGLGGNDIQVIHKRYLHIPKARRDHSGIYSLELINPLQTKTNKAHIIVAFQPRIRSALKALVVQESGTAKFVCPVEAADYSEYPISHISWIKELAKQGPINITENDKYSISQKERSLTIHDVIMSDAAKYRCRVTTIITDENEAGGSTPSLEAVSNDAQLQVTKKLKWLQTPQNYLEVDKQGMLTCAAEGEGLLKWKFYLYDPNGNQVELKNEGDTYVVNNVGYENRGTYECTVQNSANEKLEKTFTVAVGTKPTVITEVKNTSLSTGSFHSFDCKGVGKTIRADNMDVGLTISWMFKPLAPARPSRGRESKNKEMTLSITGANYQPDMRSVNRLEDTSRQTLLPNVVLHKNGTLQILSVDQQHVGAYRCLVSNNYTLVYSEWLNLSLKGNPGLTVETDQESDLLRTVLIVVGCAIIYISLVIVLTVYCSFRMWRRKAKRTQLNQMMEVTADNRHKADSSTLPMENCRLLNGVGKTQHDTFQVEFTACSQGPASIATSDSVGSGTHQTVPLPSLDTRSCISDESGGGASSIVYGVAFGGAGTPANSTIESTVDRLCHKYQKDRRRDFVLHKGLLGRGLFGEVRLGNALKFSQVPVDSLIMVKYLTTHDPNLSMEFINQIKWFAKFDHVNVTKLLGVCTESGQPPLCILEYCAHGNLSEILQNIREGAYEFKALREANQVHMALQIAGAMEHLHSLGFVHRDLAAHNILVSQDFKLKVTNMGPCLDRFVGHYYGPLRKHQLLPIRWLPPEAIVHDCWTSQTDVWSFAILLTEILNYGRLPYAKLTDNMILELANRGYLLPEECLEASANVPSYSQEILQIVRCCCIAEASQRPTFQQIYFDISRIVCDTASV